MFAYVELTSFWDDHRLGYGCGQYLDDNGACHLPKGVAQMNVLDDRNEDSGLVIPLRLVAVNGWGVYPQKHLLPLRYG